MKLSPAQYKKAMRDSLGKVPQLLLPLLTLHLPLLQLRLPVLALLVLLMPLLPLPLLLLAAAL